MDNQQEKQTSFKGILALTICALIWGTAFVAQAIGADSADPLTFNWARSILATVFLTVLSYGLDKYNHKDFTLLGTENNIQQSKLLKGGFLAGAMLTTASFFQQFGIMQTSVGKAGFITALYIVFVPLFCNFTTYFILLPFFWLYQRFFLRHTCTWHRSAHL